MSHALELLIAKLNDVTRRAAEQAVVLCKQRGHHEVDLEHIFLALLGQPVNDLTLLCRHFGVNLDGLREDLEAELQRETRQSPRPPVFSVHVPVLLEQAWLMASLASPHGRIRSGHLLLAWLTEPTLDSPRFPSWPCNPRTTSAFRPPSTIARLRLAGFSN